MNIDPIFLKGATLVGIIYGLFFLCFILGALLSKSPLHIKRTLSVLILVALLLGILALPPIVLAAFLSFLLFYAIQEIHGAVQIKNISLLQKPYRIFAYATSLPMPFLLLFAPQYFHLYLIFVPFLLFCMPIFTKNTSMALDKIARVMVSLIVGIALSHLMLIRGMPDGLEFSMLIIFLTNISDMSAYFFGKTFGRKWKLKPHISPGKTVAGSALSLVTAIALAVPFHIFLSPLIPLWKFIVLAIGINITAQYGDLIFSVFKRDVGLKDYGNLIPGHGGILDRFDSLIVSIPLAYLIISLLQIGTH